MTRKKVMVAMSGGVDSSVAAALLLKQGYDVIGVTMQIWPDESAGYREIAGSGESHGDGESHGCGKFHGGGASPDDGRTAGGRALPNNGGIASDKVLPDDGGNAGDAGVKGGCCSLAAVSDARRVADKLGIPYYVLNFKESFEKQVIDYFTKEYLAGRTPNPCIACNRHIKFGLLLKKALAMGMDYIATGHYALIEYDSNRGRYLLKKSKAGKKDQTYALYNFTQEQLAKTLLPLGNFNNKDEIRRIAAEIGLSVADKPDSQEICFVTGGDYGRFIQARTGKKAVPGFFIDTKGNILGEHKGIIHYTVGQRKGLGIAFGKPMYVKKVDVGKNLVVLGEENEVYSKGLFASDLNWILFRDLVAPIKADIKIRYNAKETPGEILPLDKNTVKVVFDKPQRAVTPGQSAVFYQGDIVVGGGIVTDSF